MSAPANTGSIRAKQELDALLDAYRRAMGSPKREKEARSALHAAFASGKRDDSEA